MLRFASIFTLSLLLMTAPSLAQGGPEGVAVAQAPEAGTGICFGYDPGTTMQCARAACAAESGLPEGDCNVDAWCKPAGWTVDIFQQHQEGIHWHAFSCGWQTQAQAEAAAAISCISEWLIECSVVRIWDPDGQEIAPDGML